MKIEELLSKRRSIRRFKEDLLNEQELKKILEAGIISPSGKNLQPWKFVVVSGDVKKRIGNELARVMERVNPTTIAISECSHLILVFNTIKDDEYAHVSIGASIENMLLQATDMGIGSLWIGYIRKIEEFVNREVNENYELVSAVALGMALEDPNPKPRKSFDEVVKFI